jgi:hypothetical protein
MFSVRRQEQRIKLNIIFNTWNQNLQKTEKFITPLLEVFNLSRNEKPENFTENNT